MRHLLCFCCFIAVFAAAAEKAVLRMAMPDYPPYTYVEDGQYQGEGYDAFVFIMQHLQRDFHISLVPNYGRAVLDLQNEVIDGLFLASENAERNNMAVFSDPVSITRWTWVWLTQEQTLTPDSSNFASRAIVSAQINSNIYLWLKAQGYRVAGGPNNIRDLFRLLNNRRVDAIMLPEQTALTVIKENNYPLQNYQFKTMRELPFAIYISKRFLEKEPDFMVQLNNAIAEYQQSRKALPQ
ncbi:ABC-type amino acid transport substrate-binding protein [Rheinheimera pacifica]|uniref:ABC-type amino acid transport substrate-binding protein n=1 Tax=Rheinheimera pacifica TaxID=173990 RepID=A0A1H6N6C0_9GAMM|nr:transporter substrate-binding domain-containing protein [Rheinheimera pacifica]SEI05955.1 ABC-type amino acid transport substrate-binding protein [Rheinheimera pacifica]